MVPLGALPPGTPLTAQATLVFAELVTVAVKLCWLPRMIDGLDGETVTVMAGGGGGRRVSALPPPQPAVLSTRRAANRKGRRGS